LSEFEFVCSLAGGLHARPASHLAELANTFTSNTVLTNVRTGLSASLKSVLAILAADVRRDDLCSVQISGSDEQTAHTALRYFVERELPGCDVHLASYGANNSSGTIPRVLQAAGVTCYFGQQVSQGIARGKVVMLNGAALHKGLTEQPAATPEMELERFQRAITAVRTRIQERLTHPGSELETAVLQADLAMAGDVTFVEKVKECIYQGQSAGQAILETGEFFVALLRRSENEYIRERGLDIDEICQELLGEIYGLDAQVTPLELREPSVLVAETLAPQQLLRLGRERLKAIVLEHPGATSHAVILARSFGIPTLVGVENARRVLTSGDEVMVDANRGFVVTQFSPPVEQFYERELKTLALRQQLFIAHSEGTSRTKDGKPLEIGANACLSEELVLAFKNGADGIGLFRTEMALLQRDRAPSEEEQVAIYTEAARAAAGRPVILRTLDLGADKPAPYLKLPHEANPFLGYRGVRIYAEHQELLQTQLRAILRASAFGNIQVMAPMISSLEEVVQFKAAIAQAQQGLLLQGFAFRPNIRIGIMLEVPSAAFILDQLCAEVDFFSIGTNDLNQYFVAVDRDNPKIARLSNVRHPGFLRFLKQIVDDIHRAGKWVGMCGEMAGSIRHLPLLVGIGLDEISVSAAEIPDLKNEVSQLSAADCERLLTQALACPTAADVDRLLERSQQLRPPQPLLSEDLVLLGSRSTNKEEALQEIVDAFFVAGRTTDRTRLEEALWAREIVYSTGLGYGFATPHCKTEAVTADSIAILKLARSINWGSVDNQPVHIIILMAMREPLTADRHLQVFSRLARKLMDEEFRERVLELDDAGGVVAYFSQQLEIPLSFPE
jgi:multiphosphoryl transfer protein